MVKNALFAYPKASIKKLIINDAINRKPKPRMREKDKNRF
jgi:hypothetical protein